MACIDDERQMGYENRNGQGEQVTMSILDCTAVELSEKIKAGTCTAMEAMEAVVDSTPMAIPAEARMVPEVTMVGNASFRDSITASLGDMVCFSST